MFVRPGVVANCDAGGVISFAGDLLHSGHPISRGTRYILVAFLYSYNGCGDEDERAVTQNLDEDRTSAAADGDKDRPRRSSAAASLFEKASDEAEDKS